MTEKPTPESEREGFAVTELAPTQRADAVTPEPFGNAGPGKSQSPQPRVIGRFRIEAKLGSGGMGDVYRAHDPMLERDVALKVLHAGGAGDGTQGMRRVLREARAAAGLTHPNTVTIYEVGEAEGEVFIAMELLDGEDLRAVLDRGDASLGDRLRWLLEAARALGAAHARGLVHRDVKPENMFVCKGGTLKLLDFGIAKRHEDEEGTGAATPSMGPSSLRTALGRRVGTPRYMAPEQHAGEATDARTDEYAWALVAFELLTGTHLGDDLATMTRDGESLAANPVQGSERLATLRAKVPQLAEPIALAIARALEPHKEDRIPSMTPIIELLEQRTAASLSPPSAASARSEAPARVRPRGRRWAVAALVALAAAAGVTALVRHRSHTSPASAAAAEPACHVERMRSVPVTPDDRVALLPNGQLVVARNFRSGILLEQITPEGSVPTMREPSLANLQLRSDDDLTLEGTTYGGVPSVVLRLLQNDRGDVVTIVTDKHLLASRRIAAPLSGLVTTSFGGDLAVIATTPPFPGRRNGLPTGTEAYLFSSTSIERTSVEAGGGASFPAVATQGDVAAVVYSATSGLHYALVDRRMARIGDVYTVAETNAAAAVAFVGTEVAVFWAEDDGGKTRLQVASLATGAASFTTPRAASDEPLSPRPPVSARLPNGDWAVAWLAARGALSALRVSPIGAGGTLVGPTEIAKGTVTSDLRAMATDKGISYLWHESDKLVRVADVSCAAPSGR